VKKCQSRQSKVFRLASRARKRSAGVRVKREKRGSKEEQEAEDAGILVEEEESILLYEAAWQPPSYCLVMGLRHRSRRIVVECLHKTWGDQKTTTCSSLEAPLYYAKGR
jgi:hypothetical protein